MGRFSFVGRRVLHMVPVALGVTIIAFFLIHLIPGDPVIQMLGNHYTPRAGAALRHQLGLDKPFWQQYFIFMGNLFQGNLGSSIFYKQPVLSLIEQRLEPSIWLILYSAALAAIISVPLAVLSALNRDGIFDQIVRGAFTMSLAMPGFLVGIILIFTLGLRLGWFPLIGFGSNFPDHLYHLFLPALTISLGFSAVLIRSLRNSLLTVLQADYVDTARAKGVSWPTIVVRHVLRNALTSTVSIFGINIAFLIGSIVIIENVFAIPGIGTLLINAVSARDYPVVQGITLLIGIFVVLVNLFADVAYAILDPRVSIE